MKKIKFFLFGGILLVFFINTGCSKKSAGKPTTIDTTGSAKHDTTITSPPLIIDTVTVAGGNGIGSTANKFNSPYGISIDASGNIYVVDQINQRVQEWLVGADSGVTVAGGNGAGAAANQLNYPQGMFLDAGGNIYVADESNNRIQEWAPGASTGITVAGGNGAGSAADQLHFPRSVFLDASGNIYVADQNNARIQVFPPGSTSTTNGVTVAGTTGSPGSADSLLDIPDAVFVDAIGNIYVSDAGNNRIQKFPAGSNSTTHATTVAGGNGSGHEANQLINPTDVIVDADENVYVCDWGNNRVQKWTLSEGSGINIAGNSSGNSGSAYDLLNGPYCIFLDAGAKNLYITDGQNNRVQKWGLKK
jgi:sugar lactone lactonase YvrE